MREAAHGRGSRFEMSRSGLNVSGNGWESAENGWEWAAKQVGMSANRWEWVLVDGSGWDCGLMRIFFSLCFHFIFPNTSYEIFGNCHFLFNMSVFNY